MVPQIPSPIIDELIAAYKRAYKVGITTKGSIEEAKL